MKEAVNHPAHYGGKDNPHEVINCIEAWGLGYTLGNAVKYIARAGKKIGRDMHETPLTLEDLEKARWYVNHEVVMNGGQDWSPDSPRQHTPRPIEEGVGKSGT